MRANLDERHAWLNLSSKVQARVELDGADQGMMVPERSPEEIRAAMVPVGGTLQGQVSSTSAPRRFVWRSDTLLPGVHRLRVTADRRVPWESDITLVAGLQVTHDVSLVWTEEELANRRRKAKLGLRIGSGVLATTFFAAAAWYATRWSESAQESDRIQAEYDAATSGFDQIKARHERSRDDARDARDMTAATGTLGALMATGFGLTWAF